ncbi:MAG: hypothetical protein EP330_14305 [Deltaproteobacteria bacterium]|nr:MAG: hypothetical protein EP330_14305 [Deltaproteobacteria bacterium]
MVLLSLTLLGCQNLSCGDFRFEGDIPVTYIDNKAGEIPIGGHFKQKCMHPVTETGRNSTVYFEPSISHTGVHVLHLDIDVDHRNDAVDWNVALNWWVEAVIPVDRIREGETVTVGDGIVAGANYWYTNGPSAGDSIEGTVDALGFFAHYIPEPMDGEIEITRLRVREGDACTGHLEFKARWDLTYGIENETASWSSARGENWFEVDSAAACAGLVALPE